MEIELMNKKFKELEELFTLNLKNKNIKI